MNGDWGWVREFTRTCEWDIEIAIVGLRTEVFFERGGGKSLVILSDRNTLTINGAGQGRDVSQAVSKSWVGDSLGLVITFRNICRVVRYSRDLVIPRYVPCRILDSAIAIIDEVHSIVVAPGAALVATITRVVRGQG